MKLCESLVPEDSEEYYLYSDNDLCVDGRDANKIVQNVEK